MTRWRVELRFAGGLFMLHPKLPAASGLEAVKKLKRLVKRPGGHPRVVYVRFAEVLNTEVV